MADPAFQDTYPDDYAQCFGCGRLNDHGHHIKSYWDGDETVAQFVPEPYHIAVPGFVYGGLIASLIDCHAMGTAAAAGYRAEKRELGSEPPLRYVTASLRVNYLRPTPLGTELTLRGHVLEVKGRRVVTSVKVFAQGIECARGEVVAVQMPESMLARVTQRG